MHVYFKMKSYKYTTVEHLLLKRNVTDISF